MASKVGPAGSAGFGFCAGTLLTGQVRVALLRRGSVGSLRRVIRRRSRLEWVANSRSLAAGSTLTGVSNPSPSGMQLPEWVGLASGYTIWVAGGQLFVRHACGHDWVIPNGVDMSEVAYRIDQHTCADLLPHRPRPKLMDAIRGSLL